MMKVQKNKQVNNEEVKDKETKEAKQKYCFPQLGKTVVASSLEEATLKVNKLNEQTKNE